jgi:hypothetical protein
VFRVEPGKPMAADRCPRDVSQALRRVGFALLLAGCSAGAWAGTARVTFVHPESFADIGLYENEHQARECLSGIAQHLEQLAERRLPPDQVLELDVLDVNLAGYYPPGHYWNPTRVTREGTPPSMTLRYRLMRDGRVLASGEETLSDTSYLHLVNRYADTDRLRFEKRMLDQWFSQRFPQQSAR